MHAKDVVFWLTLGFAAGSTFIVLLASWVHWIETLHRCS